MNDEFTKWLNAEIDYLKYQARTADMLACGKHSEAVRIRQVYEDITENEDEDQDNETKKM